MESYEHLVRGIPNNRLTRWGLKRLNAWVRRCGSRYYLVPRYRSPKRPQRYAGEFQAVPRDLARKFSVYVRVRPAIQAREYAERRAHARRYERLEYERGVRDGLRTVNEALARALVESPLPAEELADRLRKAGAEVTVLPLGPEAKA